MTNARSCWQWCVRVACIALVVLAVPAHAADPRSKDECVQMTRPALEQRCGVIFSAAGQSEQRAACLAQIAPQLDAVCERFFGEGQDFCATCTSSCTQSFPAGDGKRRECLSMCMRQPGCS